MPGSRWSCSIWLGPFYISTSYIFCSIQYLRKRTVKALIRQYRLASWYGLLLSAGYFKKSNGRQTSRLGMFDQRNLRKCEHTFFQSKMQKRTGVKQSTAAQYSTIAPCLADVPHNLIRDRAVFEPSHFSNIRHLCANLTNDILIICVLFPRPPPPPPPPPKIGFDSSCKLSPRNFLNKQNKTKKKKTAYFLGKVRKKIKMSSFDFS